MQRYVAQRLGIAIITLLGLSMIVFFFLRALPGDAAILVLGADAAASPEQVKALRVQMGLEDPLPVQYVRWIGGVVRGDLGASLFTGRKVTAEIGNRISTSLELALLALVLGAAVGIPVGTLAAVQHGRWGDQAVRSLAILGLAVPNFWLGTMVVVFGARWFGWIPPVAHTEFWRDPSANLQQFVIPALVVGTGLAASLSRMTRSAVLEVLREDYIRTARAKGLAGRVVLLRHTLRSSLIPIITLFGIQVGVVIAGTVVVENVFNLPGLGRLILDSISRKDYPLVQGIILLYGGFITSVNLVVDLTYGLVDPRIRARTG
jgi:peptide/nickel transport system permease protein